MRKKVPRIRARMENASHKYSFDKVKKMVKKEKEKYGWEFLFLGANIDAI